jgi:signal transduction histidine kinase
MIKKNHRLLLAFFGLIIILITFSLNHFLISEIRNDARIQIEQITKIYSEKVNTSNVDELTVILEVLLPSITFPLIITTNEEIYALRNIDIDYPVNTLNYKNEVIKIINRMDSYFTPIPIKWSKSSFSLIHYGDPVLIQNIQWIPYIQIGMLGIFISLILFSLHLISEHEKDKLWVGMTRETAHQLGTPISSLLGWIDLLQDEKIDSEIINSMNLDIHRLKEIADRFYKIGSKPKFIEIDLMDLSNEICEYIKNRIPSNIEMTLNVIGDHIHIMGAKTLIGWAIENLLKNSIEACKDKNGNIKINLSIENDFAILDIIDNGMGIKKSEWNNIFSAGFSKKNKGWGLGLSLTKRIIENIHLGKISVLKSDQFETIIRINLPLNKLKK